jgi:hypothetical protein
MLDIAHPAQVKIVDSHQPVAAGQKPIAQMAADKAGGACHQDMQFYSPPAARAALRDRALASPPQPEHGKNVAAKSSASDRDS